MAPTSDSTTPLLSEGWSFLEAHIVFVVTVVAHLRDSPTRDLPHLGSPGHPML